MTLTDDLVLAPDGEIRLRGHRVGLYHVVCAYNDGESAEMVASRYPTLPLSLVHRVIAFYLDNRDEVDAYVNGCDVALNAQRTALPGLDLAALRRRLAGDDRAAATPEIQIQ